MKKSVVLAGAVVFVAAAYTGVSWYVGVRAEDTLRAAIAQANERIVKTLGPDLGPLRIQMEIADYRRGVFSSEARYTLIMQDDEERVELGLDDHMQHGPFPWTLVKQGSFEPMLAHSRSQLVDTESVKRWFDASRGVMPLAVDTHIGFGGQGVSSWKFAPLEWAVDGDRLSFSGGQIDMRFSNGFRDSTGEGRFASLVMGEGAEGSTLTMDDIRLESRTATAADESVQVQSVLQVATLSLKEADEESLTVGQVKATLDSVQKAKLLDASLRYDFGSLRVGGIDLGSITVGGKLARFDFEAFSSLLTEYDAIAARHDAQADEEFELTAQDEERLLARLRPVLAASPEAALQPVVWRNSKGESTMAVSAAFQPVPANVPETEAALVEALREVRIELHLSRPMFLQAFAQTGADASEREQLEMLAGVMFDGYVDELEQQGLVQREGDRATLTLVYGGDVVTVNGRKMSLEELVGILAGLDL